MMIASFKKRPRYSLLYVAIVAFVGIVAFTDARGGEARLMKRINPAACAMFGKLDQKVTADLTNASFGDVLNVVASKAGIVVTQSPDIASSRAQQARFTIHATNVPAHIVLMEALAPFELMAHPDANGVTIQAGSGCTMSGRHEMHHESTSDGVKMQREEVRVEMKADGTKSEDADMDALPQTPAGPGEKMIRGGSTHEGPRRVQALSGREASSRSDAEGRRERHGQRGKVAARHRSSSCEVTKFARGYENRKAPSREPFVFAWRLKTEGTGRTPCGPTRL
ncbi:MAG TPA: hypothetical protein VHL58_16655 [Thermoanaerobaculia bacterium]|nr:hypothetical protein [Thermoanaerobaculia bacterium]